MLHVGSQQVRYDRGDRLDLDFLVGFCFFVRSTI
jgi:hypothetical protein